MASKFVHLVLNASAPRPPPLLGGLVASANGDPEAVMGRARSNRRREVCFYNQWKRGMERRGVANVNPPPPPRELVHNRSRLQIGVGSAW